ncbi:hypothetical protein [Brumimicrobium oceani]|uniref:Uncharacterized protein n=1 Tax=Brumimicrobium oceani TaxID=2100725 RepID=A0A2U2XGT0_9FLAO|nr:hypothetical protein [Brumimicrobium oceani]PWH87008.1 hypothetical protein DIT68_01755 [Brumimicrobium oceani]
MKENNMHYKYLSYSSPKEKIDYSYSEFKGELFMDAWKNSRALSKVEKEQQNITFSYSEEENTKALLTNWLVEFQNSEFKDFQKLKLLLKRFEVTRKIYETYDENFRPLNKNTKFTENTLYLLFSFVLVNAYKETKKLYYLNSLLKVNDILISNEKDLTENDISLLNLCVAEELRFIDNLRNTLK